MGLDVSAISDSQAEAGVIATLISHPDFMLNVTYLEARHFYNVENGCLYWAIQTLHENGVDTIDALNISNILNSNKAVKKKIEEYNLTNIQDFVELSKYAARDTLEEYKLLADNVVTLAFKRELNKVTLEIQRACFRDEVTLSDLNELVNDKISNLTSRFIVGSDSVLLGDKIDDIWEDICSRRNPDGTYGIPSVIPLFNEYFTFAKGELILLSARMKRGKSLYFMNEAVHKAIYNNVPTLYIDTEMSTTSFVKRVLANMTGIPVKRIEDGNYSEQDGQKIREAINKIKKAPLVHEYIPKFNAAQIEALCYKWKYKMNLQFLIYDYMKYMERGSASEISNALGSMCDFLKNTIAGKLDLAVLAGAQLNREDEVAASDAIERHCSTSVKWRMKEINELEADGLDGGNFCASVVLNRNGKQHGEGEYIGINLDGDHMRVAQAKNQNHGNHPFE